MNPVAAGGAAVPPPSVLGGSKSVLGGGETLDLLSAGKRFSAPGVGLSNQSRAMAQEFINKTGSGINGLLSAGISSTSTVESAITNIKAIRAEKGVETLEGTGDLGFANPESFDPAESTSSRGSTLDIEA